MNTVTKTAAHQKGLTLIEIMVAITISLALLAGVIQIVIGNKATYRTLDSLSRLQENGRAATEILLRDIRMAGFPRTDFQAGSAITGCDRETTVCPDGDAGDTVTISYNSIVDCLGNPTPAATPANFTVNLYYLNNNNLLCLGNGNVTPQVLVEGIEDLDILYGEDVNTDGTIDRYLAAGSLNLQMARVIGVQINVATRTINDNVALQTNNGDKRLRRTITSSAFLRNRIK